MNTWEMIKELTENPEKEFIPVSKDYRNDRNIVCMIHEDICFKECMKILRLDAIALEMKWEEVIKD